MKAFSLTTFTACWVALLSLLILTSCGSDNNPVSPGNAQITPLSSMNSQVPQNVFSATLTGSQEVPSVTSTGSGTGVVRIDPATNQMRATIVTADINGTQAHIHIGATDVEGPVVFSLTESAAGSGVWTTIATLTADQLSQLTAGNYYFNVHTAAYPDGEIRGQILVQLPPTGSAINSTSSSTGTLTTGTDTAANTSGSSSIGAPASSTSANGALTTANNNRPLFYINVLSGSLATPPNTSTATATGLAAYHPNNRLLTAVVVSSELAATGATIRQAAAGATGPLVGSFTETSPGSGIWILRTSLTAPQAEALNSGEMYYELLSSAFPAGELRGQIIRTEGTTISLTPAATVPVTTPITSAPAMTMPALTPDATTTPVATSTISTAPPLDTTSTSRTVSTTSATLAPAGALPTAGTKTRAPGADMSPPRIAP